MFKGVLSIILVAGSCLFAKDEARKEGSDMKQICLVVDSSCDVNRTLEIAAHLQKIVENHSHVKATIIDIATFSLDFITQKFPPSMATDITNPAIKKWSRVISKADGFIFMVSEHHNAYTGSFKNALDLLYHEWNGKPAGLVVCSSTDAGVELVANQMREICEVLKITIAGPIVLLTSDEPLLFLESLKKSFQVRAMVETLCESAPPVWYARLWNRIVTRVKRIGFIVARSISHKASEYREWFEQKIAQKAPPVVLRSDVRLGIFLGSTRNDRLSLPIGRMIKAIIAQRGGSAELIDLQDYPLSLVCHDDALGRELDVSVISLQQELGLYDGFIFVVPEYNSGMPGVLKNALDLAGSALYKKPIAFVGCSGGASGGKGAHSHLIPVLQSLQAIFIAKPLYIPKVWRIVNQSDIIGSQPAIVQHVEQMALFLNNFCASSR